MSSLAFDKQGKPFAFQRRTNKLLVRLFRNPSARGTCCQVLDADGEPLFVDPETDYMEFRKAVGHVPGLYRLDQCDEDGNQLDDAQPAYVSIDVTRNAAPDSASDVSPLAIIQQLVATQADVMKTMAAQQGALMTATAEILRAPYRPALPAAPVLEVRNTASEATIEDDEPSEHDTDEDSAPESPATAALRMIEPHLPQLGAFLYDKCAEFLRQVYSKKPASPPAATTTATTAPVQTATVVAAQSSSESVVVAAGTSSTRAPVETPAAPVATQAAPTPAPKVPTQQAPNPLLRGPIATPPGVPFVPTAEQFALLASINARLTAKERQIVQSMIVQMDSTTLEQWVGHLSTLTVDESLVLVRKMLAEAPPLAGEQRS